MQIKLFYVTLLSPCIKFCLILTLSAMVQGCANYQVRIPDSDPLKKSYQGGHIHAFFWGLWVDPEIMSAECQDQAISDVVVKSNYLYDLATVVTLGIWTW